MENTIIKGFKVTDGNMQCRYYQFEVGKKYNHDGAIELCGSGFHFCQIAAHCFNYYDFVPSKRVFEIEASGEIKHREDKSVCSDITFIREISWEEVLKIVNQGLNNTGLANTGNSNTGYSNTGNWNTGNWNTGNS